MHEYGHHIEQKMEITAGIDGEHFMGENMVDHYKTCTNEACKCAARQYGNSSAKKYGLQNAWAEGWANAFSLIAQDYYSTLLVNIANVDGAIYSDSYGNYYNIDTNWDEFSDGNETVISSILWDFYDSKDANDDGDSIAWGAKTWWNMTTKSQAKTFYNFYIEAFADNPLEEAMHKRLEASRVAPCLVRWDDNWALVRPQFHWYSADSSLYYPTTSYILNVKSEDESQSVADTVTTLGTTLDDTKWNKILSWPGETIHVSVIAMNLNDPITIYRSATRDYTKPVYKTEIINDDEIRIIGTYSEVTDANFNGKINQRTVTEIGENAFKNTAIKTVTGCSALKKIGSGAFQGCTDLTSISLSATSALTIGANAFNGCSSLVTTLPKDVVSIGDYAFAGNSAMIRQSLFASTTIGSGAFEGCTTATFFVEPSSLPSTWNANWNSSNRPVIWGCNFSSDKSYVVSFTKSATNPANIDATNGIKNPTRSGYTFGGWYATSDFSGTQYTAISEAPNGTLYAKWTQNSGSGSCVAEGTMITLADGTQKAVETLTGDEQLLVWNLWTGSFESAPIMFVDSEARQTFDVIYLTFSDGTTVKVIDEHGFWDVELNQYVYLKADASKYIGHRFKKESGEATLVSVEVTQEVTTAWSPVTYGHLCYYVNGMLSMPGGIEGLFNIFEVDPDTMKIDEEKYLADVATYGLFTYEEFSERFDVSEEIFDAVGGQYLKVAIGKGILTEEKIEALIARYAPMF